MKIISNNIFRFIGDLLIVISRGFLIKKIHTTKSVSGISLQTQFIYFLVYIFRYIDLITIGCPNFRFIVVYNFIMKILFISYQLYILYAIIVKYSTTYEDSLDNFNLPFLIFISCFASIFLKGHTSGVLFWIEEYLYTCSLALEAVAILPQLSMTQESGVCEKYTSYYICCLGLYRLNYMIHFTIKFLTGKGTDSVILLCAIIQTVLYVEFFIRFYKYLVQTKFQLS